MCLSHECAPRVSRDNRQQENNRLTLEDVRKNSCSRVGTQPQLSAALSSTNWRIESIVVVHVVLLFLPVVHTLPSH